LVIGWTKKFRQRRQLKDAANSAYMAAVAQARKPVFYKDMGVPDSLDGRFEMIVLHVFLLAHAVKGEADSEPFRRVLLETLIADMDRSLREIGVSDLSVGKKIKQMAASFFGHAEAYAAALAATDSSLSDALRRNVYGTVSAVDPNHPERLAQYARACLVHLTGQPGAAVMSGQVDFDLPTTP
jgi:cytochrome b pre-mRNA-processing protein 3